MRSEEQIRRVRDNSFRAIEMSRAAGLADICGNEPAESLGVGEACLAAADPEGDTGYGW